MWVPIEGPSCLGVQVFALGLEDENASRTLKTFESLYGAITMLVVLGSFVSIVKGHLLNCRVSCWNYRLDLWDYKGIMVPTRG